MQDTSQGPTCKGYSGDAPGLKSSSYHRTAGAFRHPMAISAREPSAGISRQNGIKEHGSKRSQQFDRNYTLTYLAVQSGETADRLSWKMNSSRVMKKTLVEV